MPSTSPEELSKVEAEQFSIFVGRLLSMSSQLKDIQKAIDSLKKLLGSGILSQSSEANLKTAIETLERDLAKWAHISRLKTRNLNLLNEHFHTKAVTMLNSQTACRWRKMAHLRYSESI
jgi:hypothetical protein